MRLTPGVGYNGRVSSTPGDQSGDQSGDQPGVGERLGRFRLLAQLGVGAMGVVYEALEENLQRRVALKLIAPALAADPAFRERFTREARALASLDSPHVVQVYAHGEEDGVLYLATQLIPDGDLGRMLRQWGPAPLGQAAALVEQVARGLADAHEAGLAHRDIKASNVLVRRRGAGSGVSLTAYLGDFGIARRFDAGAAPVAGTPSYMAPELHGGAPAGATSDLYSVGCLLWVVLTGTPPFPGGSEAAIAEAHLHAPVPQLRGSGEVVEALNQVLRRALSKTPGDRFQRASDLADDLRHVATLVDDPTFHARADSLGAASSAPPSGAPSLAARGRRALAAASALALVVVVVGAGAAFLVRGTAGEGDVEGSAGGSGGPAVFGQQDPRVILTAAAEEMRTLDTVRVSGDVRAGADLVGVDLSISAGGDCDGTISVGGGSARLRRVADATWFRADEQFWIASTDAAQGRLIARTVGDRWVLVPPEEVSSFGPVCDLDELLDGAGTDGTDGAGEVLGTATAAGREVVRIDTGDTGDTGEVVSVALDDPHHLVEIDAGRDGSYTFSEFDRPLEVRAPARGEVFDLQGFGG